MNTEVEIIGSGFSATTADNKVSFDGGSNYVMASSIKAEVSADADTLTVNVPSDAVTGVVMAKVLDGLPQRSRASSSSDVFTVVDPPTIENIVPMMAQLGATIKIAGTSFSSTFAENSVLFNGSSYVAASNFIAYDAANGALDPEIDTIEVTVPSDAQTGVVSVKVLDGTAGESTIEFEVVPTITDIVPRMAEVNATIKIAGTGFSSTFAEDSVLFSGSDYIVASNFLPDGRDAATRGNDPLTDTIEVAVPSDAMTGTISVKVLDGTAGESTIEFEVVPTITDIVPRMAEVNATIKIAGTSFSPTASEDSVLFQGSSDYVAASNFLPDGRDAAARGNDPLTDTIEVAVPSDAMTGTISVKVLDGTAATSTQTFTVEGSGSDPTPEITSIDPTSGIVGADVTISGQHFGSTPADNEITFLGAENDPSDDKIAVISTANTTQIVVRVPDDAMTGKISVTVGGETTTSSQVFTILVEDELAITSISPREGAVGMNVTISGQNFGSTPADNEITFLGAENDPSDDKIAVISTSSTTQLVVEVPEDAMTGKISVTVGGETTTSSQTFTVLAEDELAITSISPREGTVGMNVTISGQNFGATEGENEVTFLGAENDPSDDKVAVVSTASTTQLVVEVPEDAMTGKIRVMVDGQTTTSSQTFTILVEDALAITNISPVSGIVGADVTITGQNFGATPSENEITFLGNGGTSDDKIAVISTSNTTQIVVRVPDDAVSGFIQVKVGAETATSSQVFTVLAEDELAITNISPSSGSVGEEVTISGQHFGSTPADNKVTFLGEEGDDDDKVATISTASTTQLVVEVPEGAMTGTISVTVGSETTTSSQVFTVRDGTEPPLLFSVSISEKSVRVYPNPTSAKLQFTGLSSTATYMYKLHSLLGQEMCSDVLREDTIDVSDLEEGQYILVLWSEESAELLRTRLLIVR